MNILLDEQVPEHALGPLRALLPRHRIDHVQQITDPEKDPPLYWPGRNTAQRRRAPRQREGT
ncbi:hypothetical protein Pa4123_04080 [Phytohabitans aurantiacus]|uniref:DUF5615 domain-containing protein n=1 Tax=Phytohabitans aurantiacus TaxID=3016789 RepID=A0ABQ5QNK4_9ACTN|nr:hypothetical protein Pa4123_04080 [Phytohabitans aurantiacus]